MSALPPFRYHLDPLSTGAIEPSEAMCAVCNQQRGYRYTGSIYWEGEGFDLCPWCIADGAAASKYGCTFTDDRPLTDLPEHIIDEVTRRTPGYVSWQQETWLTCCDDACAFHGDASKEEIRTLEAPALTTIDSWDCDDAESRTILATYEPGGSPAFYKFVCLHCGSVKYSWDAD